MGPGSQGPASTVARVTVASKSGPTITAGRWGVGYHGGMSIRAAQPLVQPPAPPPVPSSPALVPEALVGRILARRYRLDAVIGAGAMGIVYRATHITAPEPFAVKVLPPEKARDPTALARFRREAELGMAVDHPGCVRVLEVDEHEGLHFLVMEHVDGRTLRQVMAEEGPLEPARVLRIGVQLLDALDAAHEAGVLHRDLKPANVMLERTRSGLERVRVLDFGVAKRAASERDEALTLPGIIFGSPAYMSPEQIRGLSLDVRSDLYSAAVVLLELLFGKNPFKGFALDDTIVRVVMNAPPRPSERVPGAPIALDRALLTALAKERERRWPTAAAFRGALAAALRAEEEDRVGRVFAEEAPALVA